MLSCTAPVSAGFRHPLRRTYAHPETLARAGWRDVLRGRCRACRPTQLRALRPGPHQRPAPRPEGRFLPQDADRLRRADVELDRQIGPHAVLDTRDLSIAKVQVLNADGKWAPASYLLDKLDPEKGQALRIALASQPSKVRIYYHTAPTARALQWMTPQQTMSGKRPFMFSQSEEINARSWAPVQDTPAVRFTY